MKTLIYSVLLICLMLTSTINAQTVSLMPSIKRNQSNSYSVSNHTPANPESTTLTSIASEVGQLELAKKEINQKIDDFFENNENAVPLDALVVKSLSDLQLVKQFNAEANDLYERSGQLRAEAKLTSGEQNKIFLEQAKQLEEAALVALLNAAYMNASINKGIYINNKKEIEKLLLEYSGYKLTYLVALDKIKDAERYHRTGEELRNESIDLTNNSAKLGSLQNAEEKDLQSIALQEEIKQMFTSVCSK